MVYSFYILKVLCTGRNIVYHLISEKKIYQFQTYRPKNELFLATVMTLSFRTDRSGQTVQTQIRLLLEVQSDQGLHCLLFHLHHFDKIL